MKNLTTAFARKPELFLKWIALFVGASWSFASLRRHWAFQSHAFDLGIFTNAIWNLTHGNGYLSSVKEGINLFADHQSPIFWLLGPFFALFPRAETLLVIQAFALASGAPAIYYLYRQYARARIGRGSLHEAELPSWLALALPALYWLYLPLRKANAFDFHPETMMLPLFLWAAVGLNSARVRARWLGALAFALAILCKESAGPVAAGFGLAWWLGAGPAASQADRERMRRIGGIALLAGVAAFFVCLKVPGWMGQRYAYASAYAHYGVPLSELPGVLLRQFLGPARLKFLVATLGPLAFLPLFAPRAMVAAIPGYLMMFLTSGDQRLNLSFHYAIEPAAGLFFALAPGAIHAFECLRSRRLDFASRWLAAGLTLFVIMTVQRSELYRAWIVYSPSPHARALQERVLPARDPSLPMAASEALVPHLATRRWIEPLDARWEGRVECVVLDREVGNWPLGVQGLEDLPRRALAAGMRLLAVRDGVMIFGKTPACLVI